MGSHILYSSSSHVTAPVSTECLEEACQCRARVPELEGAIPALLLLVVVAAGSCGCPALWARGCANSL